MTTEELQELKRLLGLALSDDEITGPYTYSRRRRGADLVHGHDAVTDALIARGVDTEEV